MKYLRVNPTHTGTSSTSYIVLQENEEQQKLPDNWTLEFFIQHKINENNNIDLPLFNFKVFNTENQSFDIVTLTISKNDNNQFKFSILEKSKIIEEALLTRKWNHIALVYAGDTSLIIYVNSHAIFGIDNPNTVLTEYNTFDKFLFTTYQQTNIVYFAKIRLYKGVKYNETGFKIEYPLEKTEDPSTVKIIIPSIDTNEDMELPIIKNAKYRSSGLSEKIRFEFKNKNFILEDTARGYLHEEYGTNYSYKDYGWTLNKAISDTDKHAITGCKENPNLSSLKIIDTEDKNIYYEMYDVKYQMPTVLNYGNLANKLALWCDIDNYYDLLTKQNDQEFGLTVDFLIFDFNLSISPFGDRIMAAFSSNIDKHQFPKDIFYLNGAMSYRTIYDDTGYNPFQIKMNNLNSNIETYNFEIGKPEEDFITNEYLRRKYLLNNGNNMPFTHYSLSIASNLIRAKIDGVDPTMFLSGDNKSMFRNQAIYYNNNYNNWNGIDQSNVNFIQYNENKCNIINNKEKFLRLFMYITGGSNSTYKYNKGLALFRVSEKAMTRGSFDSTIHLFEYPHDKERNFCTVGGTFTGNFSIKNLNYKSKIYLSFPNYPYGPVEGNNYSDYSVNLLPSFNIPGITQTTYGITYQNMHVTNWFFQDSNISCFRREFDDTHEVGILKNDTASPPINTTYEKIKEYLPNISEIYDKAYSLAKQATNCSTRPTLFMTTSFTRERNIVRLRNYYPEDNDWSVLTNIYFYINDPTDDRYHDIMYVSSLLGKGFMGFQVQPSTGYIRVITNSYLPYSNNIPKMEAILNDSTTTIIPTEYKMNMTEWNRVVFCSHNSQEVQDGYQIFGGWTKMYINGTEINISGTKNMSYLHRIFFFTKSLNSTIIPIYFHTYAVDSSDNQ